MGIEQKLCKVKIFKFQSISNVITYIDKRFAVKNSGIFVSDLDIQLENDNPACQKLVQGC